MFTALRSTPANRLITAEALSTLLFAALTLPALTPGHSEVPEWVQLLGLCLLLVMIGAVVHTWRLVIAGGLRLTGHSPAAAPRGAAVRLREQARAERRLRLLLASYPVGLVVLLPIPATWVWFWFFSTLAAAAFGMISLGLLIRAGNGVRAMTSAR
ncbi:hypothetical protein [Streptosporangium sp. NPDC000396]|uniref:hypothetical protein n=1 Tax=Streptosporangium sp. NPDC000396 TaxID=3366185 RepID=UPI0036817541